MVKCKLCKCVVPSEAPLCYTCWLGNGQRFNTVERNERTLIIQNVILKTVYKENGEKLQKWSIEIEGSKYRSTEGFVDGVMTTSNWTTAEGKNIGKKNETTPENQAIKEAGAKYRLKLGAGWVEEESGLSPHEFTPMLAHKYEDHKAKVTFPCFVQPKLDGMRCPISIDGAKSREGKPVNSIPHIVSALKVVFDELPGLVVDGELYNHDLRDDFNAIISIVKKKSPSLKEQILSKDSIQYHVYDALYLDQPTLTFEERYTNLLTDLHALPGIILVKTFKVDNQTEMDDMYTQFLDEGYEGMMVRSNAPYTQRRTSNLLKRKEWLDGEYIITGILEGKGNRSGMMGKFVLIDDRGESFEADASGLGGHAEYVKMLKYKEKYIGKEATVKYQNLTPDRGIPRFAKIIAIRDYEN